jgi:hypothetical protein
VTNFYVYYRVDAAKLDSLRTSVESLFDNVERATGVRGRWMRRRDDPSTYMEVYEGVADDKAFEALLLRETAGLGLERRVERFVCA